MFEETNSPNDLTEQFNIFLRKTFPNKSLSLKEQTWSDKANDCLSSDYINRLSSLVVLLVRTLTNNMLVNARKIVSRVYAEVQGQQKLPNELPNELNKNIATSIREYLKKDRKKVTTLIKKGYAEM